MTPSSMKVRLVRCPRCREVLAELPNISLYKCGGCGTILQAKHRKTEANNTVSSVTKIQRDSFPEEEEARSSDLDFPGPPLEEYSPDKDDVGFQDEAVESSSEQSEYRSAYNGLCSSPEFNCDTGECSLRHDSQIYDNKLHDSDEDSTRGGNFSGEFPSSMEANERLKVLDNIYLDSSTKVDQSDGEQSPKVWQGGDRLMDEVRIFYGRGDQDSQLRFDTEHEEGITDIYAHLQSDIVSENEATSLNHDLTSRPEEEFSSDKESRNVSNDLSSMPDAGDCQYGDSTMEEYVNNDKVKCCSGIEDEAQENGLATVCTEDGEGTNNHVHLEHYDVSKEVAGSHKQGKGINNNHVHLASVDVSKEVAGSLNHDLSVPPKEELLLDKTNIRFQDEHVESRMEVSVVRSVSNDLSSSPLINCCQNEDPLMEESSNKDHDRNSLAPDFKKHENGLHGLDGELSGGGNLSGEIRSSSELVYHETEELIPEVIEHAKEYNKSYLDQPTKVEQVQVENSLQVCPEGDNTLHEVQNISGHEVTRHGGVGSSATETVSHEDGDASPIDDGFRGGTTFNMANTNNPRVGDTVVASQVVSMGMPENLTSLDVKYVDRSPRKGSRNFGSASSVELLGDSLFSETSPEHRVKPQDTISPVTTRGYYAYDGSESSNDETDGQIPVYVPHSSRRKGKEVGYSCFTVKREGFAVKNMMSSEPEMEYWAASPLNQHHAITGSHGNSDEFSETRGSILASGNSIRLNGGGSSRLPLTSRNLHANQSLRGPSVHKNNLPPLHPGYHSPDKTSRSETDKMDMLRTVCELKDQLNRIQFPKISRDGRFPSGIMRETFSPSPLYYDHLIPGRERGVDLSHHGNYQWYEKKKGRVEQSNASALALSGEAAYYRHQVNCSCLHCRTQDWHSSAPFFPHYLHYNDRSVAPICNNSHNISSPLSSQNYSSYECLVPGHDSVSDNESHINNEIGRFYLRDRYHASKRHIRPVAGGSPFVTCYHCSETLQLPADFLVFRKRDHQLRCNACSKVLKFSLAGGKHIVPYLSRGLEVDNSSDITNERSLLVMPHSNFCQHGEPVSCSDDYGRSFCRSCSTEGEASVTVPSSGLVERKMYNRKISSVSSYGAMEDRKMKSMMKNSMEKAKNKNKKKNSVETSKSFGTSSDQPKFGKPSSEIEELPPSPNSPLHRLMGYSSISLVLNKGRT